MCIIASIPKNTGTISKDTLETMSNNNSHGFGISYIDTNNNIQTFKTMDDKTFVNKAIKVQNEFSKTSDILIHARIATSGKTNLANCHPFNVNKNTVFAHNGVLSCVEPTKNMSDTRVFNESVLKNFKDNFLNNTSVVEFLEEIIGHDKMVFLTNNPAYKTNTIILNEVLGETVDGIWFSNSSYKARTFVNSYNTNDYYNYGNYSMCTISDDLKLSADDMVEIIGEFGSIADYHESYANTDYKDKLKEIVNNIDEPDNTLVINKSGFIDTDKLFDSVDYDSTYILTDQLKELLVKMYKDFNVQINSSDYTINDWNSAMWDCFGRELPVKVEQTKNQKFVF